MALLGIIIFVVIALLLIFMIRCIGHYAIPFCSTFGLISLVITVAVSHDQAKDLGVIRHWSSIQAVHEQAVQDLRADLDSMDISQPMLTMNADSPYASMINAYSEQKAILVDAQIKIEEAKMSITRRELGLFGSIVWVMGKE